MFQKKKKYPFKKKRKKEELVDPVLYTGSLDKEKYPTLSLNDKGKDKKEVENPLNKRE